MSSARWQSGLSRLVTWSAVSSLAGAAIGLTVGLFNDGSVEAPTIIISVLFGNVVGLTAMISSTVLFSRLRGLPGPLRATLLGLALVSGSVAGTLAVLFAYPLFIARDPRLALAIVAINGVLALIVGSVVYGYETMRLRLQDSLREIEQVRLVQAELREEAARAELAALQARINPHFFFNTLNTISSLLDEEPEQAEEVVQTLADLFRYTFNVAGSGPVTLGAELDFTRNYLTIEQTRFEERLGVDWQVDPAAREVPLPGLTVQPLVENAVGHGIAPLAAGGTVTIAARVVDGMLEIVVTDDGVGLGGSPSSLIREGHGLANVRERLTAHYGERGTLELRRNPGGSGAQALLRVPAREHDPGEEAR